MNREAGSKSARPDEPRSGIKVGEAGGAGRAPAAPGGLAPGMAGGARLASAPWKSVPLGRPAKLGKPCGAPCYGTEPRLNGPRFAVYRFAAYLSAMVSMAPMPSRAFFTTSGFDTSRMLRSFVQSYEFSSRRASSMPTSLIRSAYVSM